MRRLLIGVACLMFLAAAMPAMAAWPDDPLIGYYNMLSNDGTIVAEITEKVFPMDETYNMTGFANAYLYSYTVFNDRIPSPGIWCWGFMEDPSTWGANVIAWAGTDGWTPTDGSAGTFVQNGQTWSTDPYNCACPGGGDAGWIDWDGTQHTGGILPGIALNEFWLVATNPPHKMVDAFVHGGDPLGTCPDASAFGYGKISAPTPEPVSAVLLLLGLPAAAALRKRRE